MKRAGEEVGGRVLCFPNSDGTSGQSSLVHWENGGWGVGGASKGRRHEWSSH